MTGALGSIRQVVRDRHTYACEWKGRTGGKVVGYFCTYFPEEIIYAAGALPVRVLGGHEPQDVTEQHIFSMYCPYARDCLGQGLLGRYDYLDGIGAAYSCVHIYQAFDAWRKHIPIEMSHSLYVPAQVAQVAAAALYSEEVAGLKSKVEDWLGLAIGEQALREAIAVYNDNRRLLEQLYALRREDPPKVSGLAAMEIVLSSQIMDKRENNALLEQLLKQPLPTTKQGPRIMLIGSVCDHLDLVELLEELGANVVVDDLCTGGRCFWDGEVATNGSPVAAIAERYVRRPPCATKDLQGEMRKKHLLRLTDDYKVQGVFSLRQKFCESHAFDIAMMAPSLKERGIPTLSLELDFTVPLGQYRTRVEAFLEMLELEVV